MKYMLLICADENAELTAEQQAEIGPTMDAWLKDVDGRGVRLLGSQLRPVSDATTVRTRGGDVLVADGPFAETKEQIAGFDIIECTDLDEAIDVASRHPVARFGSIEVRPFWTE
ncbi:MAG TPA: YciI family protein [Streptosporangiaceae bacterium]|nr:YciI family protein [Streptosporangiaceae bacterium]